MSSPQEDVEFCPTRASLHWSQASYDHVQFADFDNVQVATLGNVEYFKPSDSDAENALEVNGGGEFKVVTK